MLRLLALALALAASPAAAELMFCNETGTTANVAIGYSDDGVWTSEGWWRVKPNSCAVAVGGDLTKRFYYWRATVKGEAYLTEDYYFCTSPQVFTIAGDTDCAMRGYERAPFTEIDLNGATSWTVILDETAFGGPIPGEYDDQPAPPMHSTDESAAPGTHGEPYSISGLLSHCEVFDASMACEVHANGWRYVANSADPTAPWLLEELLALPSNTPIGVSGDLMSYAGITANVTIREYELTGFDPYSGLRSALQGLWRSVDDADYQVIVHGGVYEDIYGGQPGEAYMIEIETACEGSYEDGPVLILHPLYGEDGEPECLVVHDAGAQLRLFPVGGTRDLVFDRVN